MIQILLLFFFCFLGRAQQVCLNQGNFDQDHQICNCPEPYLGQDCGIHAVKLGQPVTLVKVEEKFGFMYLEPPLNREYRLAISICSESEQPNIYIQIFFQHQNPHGQIISSPISPTLQIHLAYPRRCILLQNMESLVANPKTNGEKPRFVLGIRRLSLGSEMPMNEEVLAIMYQMFELSSGTSFFFYLIIAFLAIFVISALVLMCERLHKHYRRHRKSNSRTSNINKLMPVQKFKDIGPATSNSEDENCQYCTICLTEFEAHQQVRVTPCQHIYHQPCIDGWLHARSTCPICRQQLEIDEEQEGDGQVQMSRVVVVLNQGHIREPIF